MSILDLAADQRVELDGLTIEAEPFVGGSFMEAGLEIADNDGTVWIESCIYEDIFMGVSGAFFGPMHIDNSAEVVLRDCDLVPVFPSVALGMAGPALEIEASSVYLHGCDVQGFSEFGTVGAPAIELSDAFLFATNSTVTGGVAFLGTGPFGACEPATSGAGLVSTGSSSQTRFHNVQLQPGGFVDSAIGKCDPGLGTPGPASLVQDGGALVETSGTVVDANLPGLLRSGDSFEAHFSGPAGAFAVMYFTRVPIAPLFVGALPEPLYLLPSAGGTLVSLQLDAAGEATLVTSGTLPPSVDFLSFVTQTIFVDLSAPAGQGLSFGPPELVVLGSGF